MSGYIRKKRVKNNFTVMPNEVAQSNELSWGARGLLLYLLSLPEDWRVMKSELHNNSIDGRHRTGTAFKELEDLGYITRNKIKNEKGQFKGYEYVVSAHPYEEEIPSEKPSAGFPSTGFPSTEKLKAEKPSTENQPLHNIYTTKETEEQNKEVKKENTISGEPETDPLNIDKNEGENKRDIPDTPYHYFIELYNNFCIEQTGVGAKIDGIQGKHAKQIIKYLERQFGPDKMLIAAKRIFDSWHLVDKFRQQNMTLAQINSNLINIIADIKRTKKEGQPKNNNDAKEKHSGGKKERFSL